MSRQREKIRRYIENTLREIDLEEGLDEFLFPYNDQQIKNRVKEIVDFVLERLVPHDEKLQSKASSWTPSQSWKLSGADLQRLRLDIVLIKQSL